LVQSFRPALPFLVVQGVFWVLVIRSWFQLRTNSPEPRTARDWLALGSLACGSTTLVLTAAMTIYSRAWQRYPFDRLESAHLFYTTVLSLLGILFALTGKRKTRVIGVLASTFTLGLTVEAKRVRSS
jgi:cytochrome bd-type quinol oxidase subunit 2